MNRDVFFLTGSKSMMQKEYVPVLLYICNWNHTLERKQEMRRESRLSVTDVCYIAIMAAVTAVLAQIAIPMPMGVPMTMQTFAVTLCGILLGSRKGAVSMVIYLLIGTAGVPVFSAFTGGVQCLVGPTGGFLVSFPVMAYLIGLGVEWKKKGAFLIFLLLGTAFNYVAGVLFFVVTMDSTVWAALTACVLPFLPTAVLKAVLASIFGLQLRKRLQPFLLY